MSLNTIMNYSALQRTSNPAIAPCNPKDIKFHKGKYFVNYVLLNTFGAITPYSVSFRTYANAYLKMNQARKAQGFKSLPPFKPYRG